MARHDSSYQSYISRLSDLEKQTAPKDLFWEGDFSLLTTKQRVSIVGSRNASTDGLMRAKILTKALVQAGFIIVSGLAEGIDTVAHETAIAEGGKTIAVLGTPLSRAYPAKNKELLEIIKKDHLAISQFPEGQRTYPSDFPKRNRTMALISDATVIVEASEKSGTRHQGWEALKLGRLVYIMKNVLDDKAMTWPLEMINYGAQELTREELPAMFDIIPSFTSNIQELAY